MPQLESDPFVAKRVRSLCISPFLLNDILRLGLISPSHGKALTSWLKKRFAVKWLPGAGKRVEKANAELADPVKQSIIDSIADLYNVTEYNINLNEDDQTLFLYDPILVTAGWSVFGEKLSKLSISGTVDQILSVLPRSHVLRNLREITIDGSLYMFGDPSAAGLVFERLAAFITGLGSVHSLKLTMLESYDMPSIDISLLFRSLKFSPLEFLFIHVRFETLGDPSTLARFISEHRDTLKHLAFYPHHPSPPSHLYQIARSRVRQTFSRMLPIDLLSLELDLHCLTANSTVLCVQPFSNTLTSLVLTGKYKGTKYFTYAEVEVLVSVFSHRPPGDRLTVLMLGVNNFSTRFLDLLSDGLPSLEKLCITIDNPVSDTHHFRHIIDIS